MPFSCFIHVGKHKGNKVDNPLMLTGSWIGNCAVNFNEIWHRLNMNYFFAMIACIFIVRSTVGHKLDLCKILFIALALVYIEILSNKRCHYVRTGQNCLPHHCGNRISLSIESMKNNLKLKTAIPYLFI